MKITDFLKPVMSKVFKDQKDLDLFLSASALKDFDVPDETVVEFNNLYLTRDRALTDDEILKNVTNQVKGSTLKIVDKAIDKIKPKLKAEDQAALDTEKNTYSRLEMLNNFIDNLNPNEDIKKVNEAFRKKENEFHEKIKGLEDSIKEKDTNFDKKIKESQRDFVLRGKIGEIQLADEYTNEKIKAALAETTLNSLKSKYVLDLDETDPKVIHVRKNVDGLITDVHEGNTKVTLDVLLQKEYEPFIKKSNAGDKQKDEKQVITLNNNTPKTGATLYELMREQAQ